MTWRALLLAVAVSACAGSEQASDVGRVQASLLSTQAGPMNLGPQLGVNEIIVTIEKVTAHSTTAGWVKLSGSDTRVDILRLAQYAAPLGFSNVPAGHITQLRLYVKEGGEQYVTRTDGQRIDLKVPSGLQSGIKLKGDFDVSGCQSSNVPLQFDGKKSIWVHPTGQGDLWILRPVIRTGKIETTGMCPGGGGDVPGGEVPGGGAGGGNGSIGGTGGGSDLPVTEDPGGTGGTTPVGGSGSICGSNSACLSGACVGGTCSKGGADAPCNLATDCVSGACTTGACTTPPNAVGSGAPCAVDAVCLSGACVAGQCEPGGQGKPCAAASDCLTGYSCSAGSCQPPIN